MGAVSKSKNSSSKNSKTVKISKAKPSSKPPSKPNNNRKIVFNHVHYHGSKSKVKTVDRNVGTPRCGAGTRHGFAQTVQHEYLVDKVAQTDMCIDSKQFYNDMEGRDNLDYSCRLYQAKLDHTSYISMIDTIVRIVNHCFSNDPNVHLSQQEVKEKIQITQRERFVEMINVGGSVADDIFQYFCKKYQGVMTISKEQLVVAIYGQK